MRSQLALFAILGIVILILFAGVYAVVFTASKSKATIHTGQQTSQQEGSQAVQAYAQHCFESGVNRALNLFGKQGGVIYESQGGRTPDPSTNGVDYSLHLGYKVNYLLFPPEETSSGIFFATPPEYPWETYPYLQNGQVLDSGYFGKTTLAPLYSEYGANSWQSELEHFVQNYLNTSCDFQQWKGLNILPAMPNVSVRIAENTTYVLDWQKESPENPLFIAEWPILVNDKFIRASTRLNKLVYTPNVRLAKLYFFVKSLLIQDSSNMSFSMNGVFPQSFGVTVYHESSDSVISVNDQGSVLNNKKFEFWFARKNRPPALWYIAPQAGNICAGSSITIEDHDETLPSANDAALYLPLDNLTIRKGECSCLSEFCLTNSTVDRLISGTQILNQYTAVGESLSLGTHEIPVEGTTGFSVGDEVLLIGMTGASAGLYESHTISKVQRFKIYVAEPVQRAFAASPFLGTTSSDKVQLVRILRARTLIVTGKITAQPWDGRTGGVIAINAQTIDLRGSIDSSGTGFRGGEGIVGSIGYQGESALGFGTQRTNSNAGGGGGGAGNSAVCGASSAGGGAGAGHKSSGANSGGSCSALVSCSSDGGTSYALDASHIFMGSGGGGGGGCSGGTVGNGAAGGGIIMVTASSITGSGKIISNGASAGSAS